MKTKLLLFSCLILYSFCNCQVPSSERSEAVLKKQCKSMEKTLKDKGFTLGDPIFIRIFKAEKELEVWLQKDGSEKFTLFKTYPICTYGSKGLGPKLKEGDQMAPEGFYYVPKSKMNPNSSYHLAFNLGYPNKYDEAHKRTGSALMVHGNCVSIGCYAMTDPIIEEIYTLAQKALENDQKYFKVHCFPFRMTDKKLSAYKDSKWIGFWQNLQVGYKYFEKNGRPPEVTVKNKEYVFE